MSLLRRSALWVRSTPQTSSDQQKFNTLGENLNVTANCQICESLLYVSLLSVQNVFVLLIPGLTALRSDEVIDLMIKEYPPKHAEYSVILQERERQRIDKEYSVSLRKWKNFLCWGLLCLSVASFSCSFMLFYRILPHSKCSSRTPRRSSPVRFQSILRRQLKKLQSLTVISTGNVWKRGGLTLTFRHMWVQHWKPDFNL